MQVTLKTARELKGLTQTEAAKLLDISKDTLSNYERGKSYPEVPMIKKIEELYGFTYDQKVEIRCPKCRIKRVDAIVNGKGHTYEWLLNVAVNNWNQRWEGGEK